MTHIKNILSVLESGERHQDCPECGRLNDTLVNPERCYHCGHEWAGDAE